MILGRYLRQALCIAAILCMLPTGLVSAQGTGTGPEGMSPQQRRIYRNNIRYFDYKEFTVANCIGAGSPNLTVGKDFNLGGDPVQRRINLMKALMADFGLTPEQTAGIVGNFMWESGGEHLPPNINEGRGPGPPAFSGGYGWAQWTGPRQRTFIKYAVDNGFMASQAQEANDAANYAYLKHELATSETTTIPMVKRTNTPAAAAQAFEAGFERAGNPVLDKRIAGAEKVFAEYSGGSGGTAPTAGSASPGSVGCSSVGGAAIVGGTAFPLITTKSGIQNRYIFGGGNTGQSSHPYTAYDILTTPGTEVVAFSNGIVTSVTQDRCPGRMVSVYNTASDLTVSYLHMAFSNHVNVGDSVTVGGHIGVVGPPAAGCGTPHLHIDVAKGKGRPGCSRLNCAPENSAKFVDIGPQLFQGFEALPE